jgi:hypothetical protein
MDEEKQRIKIAEACGWKRHPLQMNKNFWIQFPSQKQARDYRDLPDYLNDLNAMHEAKKALWAKDWAYRYIFNDHLANIIKGRIVNRNEWDAETFLDATAAEQAEAFLKTLGLWEE